MKVDTRTAIWSLVAVTTVGALLGACSTRRGGGAVAAASAPPPPPPHAVPLLVNDSPLAPSFVHVDESHGKVDVGAMGDAVQCQSCHADIVAQWDGSAHHGSSFTNRFYASSVDLTRKEKSKGASRFCAGCHDPSLLLNGSIDADVVEANPRAGDGVACLVCHSITKSSRLGGGGYTLALQPFVEPKVKDPTSVAAHKTAMKTPQMSEGEFCASCHKVSLGEEVNGKRWYRGQNDFDPWEQGPYGLGGDKAAGAIYAPDVAKSTCQDCHMAHETATDDLAAKVVPGDPGEKTEKKVRSHRFLAANTMLPVFAKDPALVEKKAEFLRDTVRVDVIAVRAASSPMKAITIPDAKIESQLAAGTPYLVDVVVENTKVGHKFPTGTADSNEIWLEFEVRDATGKLVADSGYLTPQKPTKGTLALVAPGGELDSEAHTFNVLQLDSSGKPAKLRDAHRFAASGFDNTIGPRDAKVVRFALTLPTDVGAGKKASITMPLSVRARVLYRKFAPSYTTFACNSKAASLPPPKECPEIPIVEVARDEVVLGAPEAAGKLKTPMWKRLDAYARGLLNALQEEVGDAEPVLAQVIAEAPEHAEGLVDLARLYIRQGRTKDALAALDRAMKIDGKTPVIPYLRGLAHYEVYRLGDAVEPLELAVAGAPKNLMSFELLAEGLELKGDDRKALDVALQGLLIDPEDAQLHHLEALAFDKLNLPADADIARVSYLRYRRDDDTPRLRTICKNTVPGCAREANPLHKHELRLHL